ncbi:MAG: site-2 protease family protein [Candidatus Micrarchaeota archaeon]|nr:site-2 protease family protein [Candidatus Micrarchaeota archaeon]MDE1847824.1 site-2 protease family protein [Candidatus Micrarchaeota archaeon]MDE1864370.1 site-2 protease family protein [Candidatus Micrarchaeota archaeon]
MPTKSDAIRSKVNTFISVVLILFELAFIVYLARYSTLSALWDWVYGLISLVILSWLVTRLNNFRKMSIFYLVGSSRGINFIDSLSKRYQWFWRAMADWGFVVSLGLLSHFFFGQTDKKTLAIGIITAIGIFVLIFPYYTIAFQFINLPQLTSITVQSTSASAAAPQSVHYFVIGIILLLLLIGGFALLITSLIIYVAASTLYGIASFLGSVASHAPNVAALSAYPPGVAPLLPGIDLPFFAGIVTFIILLTVHESSHGVLARMAKVRLKEIGVLMFGAIPVGAYVEPDDMQVKKLKAKIQNRILIAGIASNLLVGIIAFIFVLIFATHILPEVMTTTLTISALVPNSPATGVIPPGAKVLSWNNISVGRGFNLSQIAADRKPFSVVNLVTSKGNFSVPTNATGKIGVFLSESSTPIHGSIVSSIAYFLYVVLSLSFLFNLLVGIANLLPIPGLDGWQIYQLRVKNNKLLKVLSYTTIIALLITILPWIWTI